MWRTSTGNRVLRGAEAKLFALGVLRLVASLEERDGNPNASAMAFYRLAPAQRAVVLAEVVEAMLRRSIPAPQHTQVNEATIAAVFDGVGWELGQEIDAEESHKRNPVRQLIRRIMWSHKSEEPIPAPFETESEEWDGAIEYVKDRIFHDRDFEDDPPEHLDEAAKAAIRDQMGIAPGYFAHVPDSVPEPMANLLIDRIRAICDSIA